MVKPDIRLHGFVDEWKKMTMGEISRATPSSISQGSIQDNTGVFPLYGASGFIRNISTYKQEVAYIGVVKDGAGVGRVCLLPPFSSVLGTMHYLNALEGQNIEFIYRLLEKKDLGAYASGSTIPHIYFKDYSEMEVYLPNDLEQKGIASYFKSLDLLIQTTTKRIELLNQMRLASLISMFPQGDDSVPHVRYEGFSEPWRKVFMDEVFEERHEISTITDELPQLSFSIEEGVIRPENRKSNKRDFLIKDKSNKKYLITRIDDIIYNPANVIYGAIHKNSLCDGVVSPIYKIFYTHQEPSFMECLVRRPSFIKEMTVYMEGTVQKLRTLKPNSFLRMSAYIPSDFEEQRKIGGYFSLLKEQISAQQLKMEMLKQIKSSCLDKMLV
jgi:type I restriction enzyme S subunit